MSARRNAIGGVVILAGVLVAGIIDASRIDCRWQQSDGQVVAPLPDIPFPVSEAVGVDCIPTPCLPDDGGVTPCVRRPTPIEFSQTHQPPEAMP